MPGWNSRLDSLATRLGLIVVAAGIGGTAALSLVSDLSFESWLLASTLALAAGWIARGIATRSLSPISSLVDVARRISDGETNVELPRTRFNDEIARLVQSFGEMKERLDDRARRLEDSQRDVEEANARLRVQNEELQRVNEILEQLSITDGLTKLHNHRFFHEHLTREAKRADRSAEPLALILIDIDHFKQWNDHLGHAVGDEILRRVADIMNGLIRETDLLARYGGEEFALIAPNTDYEGGVRLAEKIRTTIASTDLLLAPPSERRRLTVSLGIALYSGDRTALFRDADRALYSAKEQGRDCVVTARDLDDWS